MKGISPIRLVERDLATQALVLRSTLCVEDDVVWWGDRPYIVTERLEPHRGYYDLRACPIAMCAEFHIHDYVNGIRRVCGIYRELLNENTEL